MTSAGSPRAYGSEGPDVQLRAGHGPMAASMFRALLSFLDEQIELSKRLFGDRRHPADRRSRSGRNVPERALTAAPNGGGRDERLRRSSRSFADDSVGDEVIVRMGPAIECRRRVKTDPPLLHINHPIATPSSRITTSLGSTPDGSATRSGGSVSRGRGGSVFTRRRQSAVAAGSSGAANRGGGTGATILARSEPQARVRLERRRISLEVSRMHSRY